MFNSEDVNQTAEPANHGAAPTWHQVLHKLNNVFASIHSSLDLALSNEGRSEVHSFLQVAQLKAREGAQLINELRLGGREPAGWELRSEAADGKREGRPGPHPVPSPASLEGSERILLVEDDESVRLLIRAVLAFRGYEIVEACDGDEAVSQYQRFGPFDLIIMDLHMPRMDGGEALQLMRAQGITVPALALSGSLLDGEGEQQGHALESFTASLNKPFENTQLVSLVRRLLNQHGAAPV